MLTSRQTRPKRRSGKKRKPKTSEKRQPISLKSGVTTKIEGPSPAPGGTDGPSAAVDTESVNVNDTLREVPHLSMRAWPYRQERRGHGRQSTCSENSRRRHMNIGTTPSSPGSESADGPMAGVELGNNSRVKPTRDQNHQTLEISDPKGARKNAKPCVRRNRNVGSVYGELVQCSQTTPDTFQGTPHTNNHK